MGQRPPDHSGVPMEPSRAQRPQNVLHGDDGVFLRRVVGVLEVLPAVLAEEHVLPGLHRARDVRADGDDLVDRTLEFLKATDNERYLDLTRSEEERFGAPPDESEALGEPRQVGHLLVIK